MTSASSSSSSAPGANVKVAELLAQGKEARSQKDLTKALEHFDNALKEAVEAFGQLAEEAAPVYLQYGKVLFELAVAQSDLFGEAVHNVQDEVAEEVAAEEDQDGQEDDDEDEDPREEQVDEDEDEEEEENNDEQKDDAAPTEDAVDDRQEEQEQEGQEKSSPDDFQLAFENIEAARLIYSKEPEKFAKELIEVHSTLGEIYMETDQFDNAEIEIKRVLEILEKDADKNQRDIASQYFLLGLACSGREQFADALTHFEQSCEALTKYAQSLTGLSLEGLTTSDVIPRIAEFVENRTNADVLAETAEVLDLLKEVQGKVVEHKFAKDESNPDATADIRAMIRETFEEVRNAFPELRDDESDDQEINVVSVTRKGKEASSSSSSSSGVKRKAEESSEEAPAKKVKN